MVLCSVSEEEEPGGRARTSQMSHGLHSWTSSGFLLSESAGKAGSHDLRCMHLPDQDAAAGAAARLSCSAPSFSCCRQSPRLLPAEHRGTPAEMKLSISTPSFVQQQQLSLERAHRCSSVFWCQRCFLDDSGLSRV